MKETKLQGRINPLLPLHPKKKKKSERKKYPEEGMWQEDRKRKVKVEKRKQTKNEENYGKWDELIKV